CFNRGPRSRGPVLLSGRHLRQDADSSEQVLTTMRWGLIPSWFKKDDPSKMPFNTSNCRSDTMLTKSSYKVGYRSLADETEEEDEWKGWRPLTMAGIFDCWEPPGGGDALYTYTIITVDASKDVSFIHHRMPAILDGEEAVRKWLDFAEVPTQEAVKLIQPTENVVFHPVSTIVNSVRNDSPECLAPIELGVRKVGAQGGLGRRLSPEASPKKQENEVPRWTSQFIPKASPKKTSAGVLQQWLGRTGEPASKRPKV
uniref:Abasic site processing protein HMCES n=1 Tax=Nothoprocta perdicaria TaxID=30464 RepID=A0A8C6Z5K7_NOTPE